MTHMLRKFWILRILLLLFDTKAGKEVRLKVRKDTLGPRLLSNYNHYVSCQFVLKCYEHEGAQKPSGLLESLGCIYRMDVVHLKTYFKQQTLLLSADL